MGDELVQIQIPAKMEMSLELEPEHISLDEMVKITSESIRLWKLSKKLVQWQFQSNP
jgi:predicted membrane GTPase involved in stress response